MARGKVEDGMGFAGLCGGDDDYERGWRDAIKRCAKIAEQTETWSQTVEKTDHNDIYTGEYETVKRTTPKWQDGREIAAAIREQKP